MQLDDYEGKKRLPTKGHQLSKWFPRHRVGHPVPHAFFTYVGYVLAEGTYFMFTKCEVSLLCQNIIHSVLFSMKKSLKVPKNTVVNHLKSPAKCR